jgi:hypothetical protein
MNQIFEVLVWNHSEDKDGCFGDTDSDQGFDNFKDAENYYHAETDCIHKILMKYSSLDFDADGNVIMEWYK